MTSLLEIPGVQSACVADEVGHLIDCVGSSSPPVAAVLVLANATLSAAAELGRRSGSGDCIEIVQHHEGGMIYLRGLPDRQTMVVRCLPETDMAALSRAAVSVARPRRAPVGRPNVSSMDLGSALHAMPAW